MIWRTPLALLCSAMIAGGAAAQATDDTGTDDGTTTIEPDETSAFDSLSTGNQKIARALFDAQPLGGETGDPVDGSLTLDDIAQMKQDGTGWGKLFQDLQAEGYIDADAKNLGQLVSGKYQPPVIDDPTTTTDPTSTALTDPVGDEPVDTGAFDALSPGNRKIAESLYDAQPRTEGGETAEGGLTLDEIAEMKQDGAGWGEMFKDMKTDGHIESDARNLGQLVSGKYQAPIVEPPETPETTSITSGAGDTGTSIATTESTAPKRHGRSTVVVTSANGGQIVVNRGRTRKSGLDTSFNLDEITKGQGRGGDKSVAMTSAGGEVATNHGQSKKLGLITAGGGTVGGGHGNSHGHGIQITTAAGTSAGGGGGHALGLTKGGGGEHGGGKALGKTK